MAGHSRGPITGAQLRAARALLGVSAPELAKDMKIGLRTIRRAEEQPDAVQITATNDQIIQHLEKRGIRFIDPNGGGPGVRMAENSPPKKSRKSSSAMAKPTR